MNKRNKLNNRFSILTATALMIGAALFFELYSTSSALGAASAVSAASAASGAASTTKPKTTPPNLVLSVPFTSQAPLGEWKDERQQDGCEEAVVAMAMAWVGNEKNISRENWRLRILILSTFENKKYGEYRDTALKDIVAWLFNDYFNYKKVEIKAVNSTGDILSELERGNVVLTPMNGRALKNPNFTAPGPERHIILIKGYDYRTKEFITNDPGTRKGENYRYPEKIILQAIRNYKTGNKLPFGQLKKEMIVVSK